MTVEPRQHNKQLWDFSVDGKHFCTNVIDLYTYSYMKLLFPAKMQNETFVVYHDLFTNTE